MPEIQDKLNELHGLLIAARKITVENGESGGDTVEAAHAVISAAERLAGEVAQQAEKRS